MRLKLGLCVLLALSAGLAVGAPPASPFPPPPAPAPPNPTPAPPTPNGGVWNLKSGSMYIVSSPTDGLLFTHPEELVTVTKYLKPLTINGTFADGTGAEEVRDFAGPFIWMVKPANPKAAGRLKLKFVPFLIKDAKEVQSDSLDINGGVAPLPPPIPVDPVIPPGPPVVPVVDAFTQSVIDAYAAELATDKQVNARNLAGLYRVAATTTVQDPTIKTNADLFADMKAASPSILPSTALPVVRKVIGARLNKTLTPQTAAIDRANAAKELMAVAESLRIAAK